MVASEPLASELRPLFWDYDFARLNAQADGDFIIGRVLAVGSWKAICWLRNRYGDEALRSWITRREGRSLTPQQLRFWELILDLPTHEVNQWLGERAENPWDGRIRR